MACVDGGCTPPSNQTTKVLKCGCLTGLRERQFRRYPKYFSPLLLATQPYIITSSSLWSADICTCNVLRRDRTMNSVAHVHVNTPCMTSRQPESDRNDLFDAGLRSGSPVERREKYGGCASHWMVQPEPFCLSRRSHRRLEICATRA